MEHRRVNRYEWLPKDVQQMVERRDQIETLLSNSDSPGEAAAGTGWRDSDDPGDHVLASLTDPRPEKREDLKKMWKIVMKHSTHHRPGFEFYMACVAAARLPEHKKKTRGQVNDENKRIAKKAKELAQLLETSYWFADQPPSIIHTLGFDDQPLPRSVQLDRPLQDQLMCVSDLLHDLAKAAEKASSVKSVMGQRDAVTARFIRNLSAFCRKSYGAPLHEVVAAAATVLYAEPITAKYVQNLVSR